MNSQRPEVMPDKFLDRARQGLREFGEFLEHIAAGCLPVLGIVVASLVGLYLLIRFIKWAWEN